MLKSLCSALLMYSRIPAPKVQWKEENRRYAMGWFPIVGVVIGCLLILWRILCNVLCWNQFIFAAVAVLLPVMVTGGIHLDGFCDVNDARASYGNRERRLQIMSDPHIGSFAVIRLCLYLILQTALFSEIHEVRSAAVIAFSYVISRVFSGFSAMTFHCAKKEGSLQDFVKPAHRTANIAMIGLSGAAVCGGMLLTDIGAGCASLAAALLCMLYYKHVSYREFGGITGDLCGWFLQICEISMLFAVVLAQGLNEVVKI
ncbi:MAG: adenosylcobinamide-GDP ribazoletransferase [Oscillospiraceae bacterium]|nr:adenosylcobinamide-GDP ribazoletransferase [Oscillospiraceae bacterium]